MASCKRQLKNGLILHTGAIGDCLLTLPLAASMRNTFGLDRMDFIGNTEYIGFYPGRTCIDGIRSSESIQLHRLFAKEAEFELDDKDRLQEVFAEYEYVVSFLGAGHLHYENNLLFTVHSTHSADVTVVPIAAPRDYPAHLTEFYLDYYMRENLVENMDQQSLPSVIPLPNDFIAGADYLAQSGINPDNRVAVIHPGSGSPNKCWHPDNFLQVAATLKKEDVQVVFLLGPAEIKWFPKDIVMKLRTEEITLENLSLTQVLQVLTQADVFLGNDSGIGHLSAAMDKRTITLFGPSNEIQYRPLGQLATIFKLTSQSFSTANEIEQQKIAEIILGLF